MQGKAPLQQISVLLITHDPGCCKELHLHRSQHAKSSSQIGATRGGQPVITEKQSRMVKR